VYKHFQESFKSLEKQGSIIGFEGQQHKEEAGVQIHGVLGILNIRN
jgi:hypothetical protein